MRGFGDRREVDELLNSARALLGAGQLADAEQAFFAALDANPREHRALHGLAMIAIRADRPDLAVEHARNALALDRRNPDYLHTLGIAHGENGELDAAVKAFQRVVRERPDYPDAQCNLGLALRRLGRYTEAEQALRRATVFEPRSTRAHVELGKLQLVQNRPAAALPHLDAALAIDPASPAALNGRGIAFQGLDRYEEALAAFREAQVAAPADPDPHNNEGLMLRRLDRPAEAEAAFRRAVDLDPADRIAANNLGSTLLVLGRLDEAAQCLRAVVRAYPRFGTAHLNLGAVLRRQGRLDEAAAELATAVELEPRSVEALNNYGGVLLDRGSADEAVALFERALAEAPGDPDSLTGLGLALLALGQFARALDQLWRAAEIQPDSARVANNVATAYRAQGDLPRAIEWYRRALALQPDAPDAWSNLLGALNYLPDLPLADLLTEHRRYGVSLEAPLRARWPAHPNDRDPDRRLRVGYVSADFREHAMAFSILPLLAHHDRERFEVFCYANNPREDGLTARMRAHVPEWHRVVGVADEEMATLVHNHGIEILVDLSGHTALNRLPVFARKPAPVQAAWLGYVTTTGLTALDYRLTDAFADPLGGDEVGYTERLLRLPWVTVFQPPEASPPVAPGPAATGGPITFGCFNHHAKITPAAIGLWARILTAAPGSRLLVGNAGEPGIQDRLAAAFATHGVARERLEFRPRLPLEGFLALHHEIDLALDTFPYNGGATSCHSLWMGVPFVALAGDRYMARMGVSLLNQVGLGELVARTPDEYVALATGLARDLAQLAALREGMRARLTASPLVDGPAFVRSLEAAYRQMWRAWCRR
jgi:protein O-GlcNAc transferase